MVSASWPPGASTVSDTANEPAFSNVFTGFCSVENVPSPKSHTRALTLPSERSVKETVIGTVPVAPFAPKFACGGASGSP